MAAPLFLLTALYKSLARDTRFYDRLRQLNAGIMILESLMILINDRNGWVLADGFILDDIDVGYDIYCTDWDMLEEDAQCNHAHLSKLFDSVIVYCKDKNSLKRLNELKRKAAETLASDRGDLYSSFMNLLSLQDMLYEITEGIEIGDFEIMDKFDPQDFENNVCVFDKALNSYLMVYEKAGMRPKRYGNVEGFEKDYCEAIHNN